MEKSACRFDLHIHSTASDGTDSPKVLLENTKNAGIGIFALTDHDTISGVLEMQRIVPDDIVFIKGIEFSCKTEAGKCHILGYNYDENAPEFKKIIEEGIGKRRRKLESDVQCLYTQFHNNTNNRKRKLKKCPELLEQYNVHFNELKEKRAVR